MTTSMNLTQRVMALQDARALLRKVEADLDSVGSACSCCGLSKKRNWTEAQISEQLLGMITRLDRMIDRLTYAQEVREARSKEVPY